MRRLVWLWVAVSLVGVGFTRAALEDAYDDQRVLQASGRNGRAKLLVRSKVRSAWIRLYFKLVCLFIGIGSLLFPPDHGDNERRFRSLTAALLVSVISLLNAETWLTLRDGERLRSTHWQERRGDRGSAS